MSKLQTYVLKEICKAFVPAFFALLAVMMLGLGVQLLQEGLDIVRLHGLPLYMAVYCAPWVLPSALLTAVIMVFGRLSADKEILAMQVEGMHLGHILYPIYFLAVLLSLLGVHLHFEAAPRARHKIENLQSEAILQVLRDRILYSAGRQFHLSPFIVRYENYENDELKNVRIIQSGPEGGIAAMINARTGTLQRSPDQPRILELTLEECLITPLAEGVMGGPGAVWTATRTEFPIQVGSSPKEGDKDIRYMTRSEMRGKKRQLQKQIAEHDQRYRNPGEKSDRIDEKMDPLLAESSELRRAKDRIQNRIRDLENELESDLELVEGEENALQRRRSDLLALREQRVEYLRELEQLLDTEGNDENERFQRISETQTKLNDVRERISDREKEKEDIKENLASLKAAKEVKERNIKRLRSDEDELQQAIAELVAERNALLSQRRAADLQDDYRELEIRTQRRLTLAFAALAFTVLGIPLGLLSKRRSTLLAFGVGFFVMLAIFYPFMVWGQIMAETGLLHVIPAMWMGNAITLFIGIVITLALFRH